MHRPSALYVAIDHRMFRIVIDYCSSRDRFMDDPFRYRLLEHEALADPKSALATRGMPTPWMR